MYKAINYWVLGGFDGNKGPYAAIEDAAKWGLDGVELTVGDCLPADITEAECKKIKARKKKNEFRKKKLFNLLVKILHHF